VVYRGDSEGEYYGCIPESDYDDDDEEEEEEEEEEEQEEEVSPTLSKYIFSPYQHLAGSSKHNWCFVCSHDFSTPVSSENVRPALAFCSYVH